MKGPNKMREHEVTAKEMKRLQQIADDATPAFAETVAIFLERSITSGIDRRVAAAAFSLFVLTNLTRVIAMCSRVPSDAINQEEMKRIAAETQEFIARRLDVFIREAIAKSRERN